MIRSLLRHLASAAARALWPVALRLCGPDVRGIVEAWAREARR